MTTPIPQEDRIIKGFRTAYKRMSWDKLAPTVTMNLMTPSSDNKLHPQQNRTLSPAEAAILQTVDRYPYNWGESPTDRELCDALGEAVPPLFFEKLLKHIAVACREQPPKYTISDPQGLKHSPRSGGPPRPAVL